MNTRAQDFSQIATEYRGLRTTDPEPIRTIAHDLRDESSVQAIDVGCGEGRYDLLLYRHLGSKLRLCCVDVTYEMLREMGQYLLSEAITNFGSARAMAHLLPLKSNSQDCIFTFNAIHHFNVSGFLHESHRILKGGGRLFVYTRLREQNSQSVWGQHFPDFSQKETRLFELSELQSLVDDVPGLKVERADFFAHPRRSSLDRLVEQARGRHYSTFGLYSPKEFEMALERFVRGVKEGYEDENDIRWTDHNTLLVVSKAAV